MSDEQRFDRLEVKIDKLTDAISQIAAVEERIQSSHKRLDRVEKQLDRLNVKMEEVTETSRSNSGVAAFADKAFWLIMGTLASVIVWFMRD